MVMKKRMIGLEVECIVPLSKFNVIPYSLHEDMYGNGIVVSDAECIKMVANRHPRPYMLDISPSRIRSFNKQLPTGRVDGRATVWIDFKDIFKEILNERILDNMDVSSDGSIIPNDNGYVGVEFKFLLDQRYIKEDIELVYKAIQSIDALVNDTCGTHVHLDMRKETDINKTFHNLCSVQDILFSCVSESRRTNNYCKKFISEDYNLWVNKAYKGHHSKYFAINPMSWSRLGTIEVRLLEGTLDGEKVFNFVRFLLRIANTKVKLEKDQTIDSLREAIRLRSSKKFIDNYSRETSSNLSVKQKVQVGENVTTHIQEHLDILRTVNPTHFQELQSRLSEIRRRDILRLNEAIAYGRINYGRRT